MGSGAHAPGITGRRRDRPSGPSGGRGRAVPLAGTRVRARDAFLLAALVIGVGALTLGLGTACALSLGARVSPMTRVALAITPMVLLTPVLVCVLGRALLMGRGPRLTLRDVGLVRPNRVPVGLLLWIPAAIVSSALATGVALGVASLLGGGGSEGSGSATSGLVADLPVPLAVALALGSVLLFPFLEEVLFRGTAHGALSRVVAPWVAVVLSAALFSLVHVSPMLMPYTLVLGLWLGWLHRRYESIVPSIVLHCCNNGLVVLVALVGL